MMYFTIKVIFLVSVYANLLRTTTTNLQEMIESPGDSATVVTFEFTAQGRGGGARAKLYVGTLRASGYRGHIILGVDPCTFAEVKEYMEASGVLLKAVKQTDCTYRDDFTGIQQLAQRKKCSADHPRQTLEIARFSLAADWVMACTSCVGPVLVTDGKDVYFQGNPFDPRFNFNSELELIAEHPAMTTKHWFVQNTMEKCYGLNTLPKEHNLNAGTIYGTRAGFISFAHQLGNEYERLWKMEKKSCTETISDQALLNSLYYAGKLNASVAKYRQGPVITVGHPGSIFWDTREPLKGNFGGAITGNGREELRETYKYRFDDIFCDRPGGGTSCVPPPNITQDSWQAKEMAILPEFLTDAEGRFTNIDGSVTPVVHQFDRFGVPIFSWVEAFGRKRKVDVPIDGLDHSYLHASDVIVCEKR